MALFRRGAGQLSVAFGPALLDSVRACCASRSFASLRVPIHVGGGMSSGDEGEGPSADDAQPPETPVDTTYRSPTEVVWPPSKQQEKFASRVRAALLRALSEENALREGLIRRLGFSVKEVRMSPDNMKAFILWDSYLDRVDAVRRELDRRMPRLRSAVAASLGARSMPRLEFRHDRFSVRQQQIEDVFRRLEEERAVEEQVQLAEYGWQREGGASDLEGSDEDDDEEGGGDAGQGGAAGERAEGAGGGGAGGC